VRFGSPKTENFFKSIYFNSVDKNGYSALMHSSSLGSLRLVKMLCVKKAKLELRTKPGTRTALMLAFKYDDWDKPVSSFDSNRDKVLKVLLESGADVNAPDRNGYTALTLACRRAYVSSVKNLLEHGAASTQAASTQVALGMCVRGQELTALESERSVKGRQHLGTQVGVSPSDGEGGDIEHRGQRTEASTQYTARSAQHAARRETPKAR
jgi:hypothetical protein